MKTFISIAINSFIDSSIENLSYAISDSKRVKRKININSNIDSIELLLDSDATLDNIISTVKKLSLNEINTDIKVFISTHGRIIDGNTYLMCYDSCISNIKNTSLNLNTFINSLSSLRCSSIELMIDACNIAYNHNILAKNITIISADETITYENSRLNSSDFTRKILALNKHSSLYNSIESKLLDDHILNVYGGSGIGKSFYFRDIEKADDSIIYMSLPRLENLSTKVIMTLLSDKLHNVNNSLNDEFDDYDPFRYVNFYTSIHPELLIIIDHVDHLNSIQTKKLIKIIKRHKNNYILISRERVYSNSYSFDNSDILKKYAQRVINKNMINDHNTKNNLLNARTFIEIIEFLQSIDIERSKNKIDPKIYSALAILGGFVNIENFSNIFSFDLDSVKSLIDKGLVIYHNGFYYPHDSLYEKLDEDHYEFIEPLIHTYWKKEIQSTRDNIKAIQNFLLLLETLDLDYNSQDNDFYKYIIRKISDRKNMSFLLVLYRYLLDKNISNDLCDYFCEILIDIGLYNEVSNLLKSKYKHKINKHPIFIELLWWTGEFDESIKKVNSLDNHNSHLITSRGIGYFFKGIWELSSNDLQNVIDNNKTARNKDLCLSYCVLATIQGLRGINFRLATKNFIESIKIARKERKISWLSLIYGNIGEIFWKCDYYEAAIYILEIADSLAFLTNNDPLESEIKRNLLHASYRSGKNISHIINDLENIYTLESENYVKMQIANTLCTHYIYIKDRKYNKYVSEADLLTKDNDEYRIYTLSNMALIHLIKLNIIKAKEYMIEALNLGCVGKNWLSIKQCLFDWDEVIKKYNLKNITYSNITFQKWHQILKKQISKYVFHLEGLYKYLESSERK